MDPINNLSGGGDAHNGGETPVFKTLLDNSMEELRLKTAGHQGAWRLGQEAYWNLNQSEGALIFTFDDGIIATCSAQIIGSFDTKRGTWLWAWENPSIHDSLKVDALRVRDYGRLHQIDRLTSARWPGTEADGWAMAALACKLCEAQGVYRGPAGTAFVFISFGQVALSKKA